MHITDRVFESSQFFLNIFSTTKEVSSFILVSHSRSLNSLTLRFGFELGSIDFEITLRELKVMFNLVSFSFIFKYLLITVSKFIYFSSFSLHRGCLFYFSLNFFNMLFLLFFIR